MMVGHDSDHPHRLRRSDDPAQGFHRSQFHIHQRSVRKKLREQRPPLNNGQPAQSTLRRMPNSQKNWNLQLWQHPSQQAELAHESIDAYLHEIHLTRGEPARNSETDGRMRCRNDERSF